MLAAALSCIASAQAGPTLERIRASGAVTIGYRATSVPISYDGPNREPMGYAIDICKQLAQSIQQQLKLPRIDVRYLAITPAQRLEKLASGAIDMECAGSTNTAKRREQVAFGLTYYYTGSQLLVRKGAGIASLADLRGKIVGYVKDTTAVQVLEARQRQGAGGWSTKAFDTTAAGIKAVESGEIQALIQDDVQLIGAARDPARGLALAGPTLSLEPLSLMLSKNDPELQALVLAEMGRLYRSGEIARLYERWFTQTPPGLTYSLDLKMHPLLRDNFRRPSAYVHDWAVL